MYPRSEKGFPARQLLFSVLYADISCHGRPSLPPQLWSAQMADGFMLTLATARVCCCLFLQTRHKNSLSSNFPTLVLSCWIWQPVVTLITSRSKLWGNHSKMSWQSVTKVIHYHKGFWHSWYNMVAGMWESVICVMLFFFFIIHAAKQLYVSHSRSFFVLRWLELFPFHNQKLISGKMLRILLFNCLQSG